jgi:arylsulfatase A-like enzyme
VLPGLGRPGFAVLSLEAPHPPYGAPASGIPAADPATVRLRPNVPVAAAARARPDLAGYYAHIQATDRAIGALVASLAEETIIVFTSVHGDMHGSQGRFRKGWPYEESVRVPLLVRHGGIAWNDRRAVSLAELPALAVAWAEGAPATPPAGPAGHARISMPSVVALPDQCDRVWSGLRSPSRKVVLNADGTPWLFFDLDEDPFELRNLVAVPSRRAELASLREAATTPP